MIIVPLGMNKLLYISTYPPGEVQARRWASKSHVLQRVGTGRSPRSDRPGFLRAWGWGLLWSVALGLGAAPQVCVARDSADVTSEQVVGAVQRGVAYLRQRQKPDGNWVGRGPEGGMTGLVVLAMLNAGVSPDDPTIDAGLAALQRVPNQRTYVVALKSQVYAAAGAQKYADELQEATDWLVRVQLSNGMWTYGRRGRGDNSNTQFALLGLHEAANAGAKVPQLVWIRAMRHFLNTQNRDGGWGYRGRASSYGSMTAAGLASLYICGQRFHVGGPKVFQGGVYPGCGKYTQNKAIAGGLRWLTRRFSVRRNPNSRHWLYYYLYALERVGMISGLRHFGTHDWYREGAAFLVRDQDFDGSWGGQIHQTAFAILFLAKGNRPVLIRKVQWNGHWNRNIHDLDNLTGFLADKLGKHVAWETTTLDSPLSQLRISPILFVTGHEFPEFTDPEKRRLREFVESGGTLLAEACCGSQAFRKGFREFAADVFSEYTLHPLPVTHPVFRSHYRIKDTYGLEGINVACRTSVLFSPNALSCLWELEDIPVFSEKAFRLGTNISAYATGSQPLANKLDVVALPATKRATETPTEVPRGAVRIARLIHNGDYNCDPRAIVHLAAMLRDRAKVDVVARARHIRVTDEKIYEYPVIFMQGHFAFKLPDEEIEALREYLTRGGFLFADSCCGRKEFDRSFRRMVGELFPESPLTPLPKDHPIYAGDVGVLLGELRYSRILSGALRSRGTTRPPLEAVRLEGRTVIIYSKYDFSCALEGDNPYSCRGYIDPDGRKLAMNIALYGISY